MNLLEVYVQAWRDSATSVIGLLPTLDEADWSAQTDCPGWTVKDVAAHLAHLESKLATGEIGTPVQETASVASAFTEAGVEARRPRSVEELQTEFADAVATRTVQLNTLPEDPQTPAPVTPGGVPWSWDTLLRNRAIDVWVHEQDIRRAIARPGSLDSAGAQVTTNTFRFAMPYVVGKKVRPAPGTTIGWHVTGEVPFDLTVAVGEDGRAEPVEQPTEEPRVLLTMTTEEFTVLGAGRRTAEQLNVEISGDQVLGRQLLTAMPVTL